MSTYIWTSSARIHAENGSSQDLAGALFQQHLNKAVGLTQFASLAVALQLELLDFVVAALLFSFRSVRPTRPSSGSVNTA